VSTKEVILSDGGQAMIPDGVKAIISDEWKASIPEGVAYLRASQAAVTPPAVFSARRRTDPLGGIGTSDTAAPQWAPAPPPAP
jgi:hypothetical protein